MVKIERILCPIDFSEFSRHALTRAIAIAKGHHASITAPHVVPIQPPIFVSRLEPTETEPLGLTPEERGSLLAQLRTFTAAADSAGVAIDVDVVEAPVVHAEIVAQAGRLAADLIVMGTHGRAGFQRLFLGSVTEKVLRTASQPVLTVGAPDAGAPAGDASFKRILCAIDFSECSIAALKYALALAEGADPQVTALHVVEWTPFGYDPLVGPPVDLAGYRMAAEGAARERLHKLVAETAHGRPVEEITTSGKPYQQILNTAAGRGSDLIVLGIHGRNPVDRMLFGSTAEPIVRRAPCPVMTVRA